MDAASSITRWCHGLNEVAADIDGWVVDQFGVMHDGRDAYPHAADALRRLVARGDTVVVLSNSGKRNPANLRRLARRGFGPDCFSALLTSGELTHQLLAERSDPFFANLGTRCWLLANDGDRSLVDGLPLTTVDDPGAADFLLLAGVGGAQRLDSYDAELARALQRGLPAVCANPDLQRLDGEHVAPSSGALARRYEALGGTVRWIGKPHADVYAACRVLLQQGGAQHIAVIGDSLEHDIGGGQAAGWTTLLVADGIHRAELAQGATRDAQLSRLCHELQLPAPPDAVLHQLAW